MNKFTAFIITATITAAFGAAACSSGSDSSAPTTAGANTNQSKTTNTAGNTSAPAKPDEETPASVKAAFPNAQSFTKQHKDIPKDAIASIEKDTGGKVPDTDHHSYLAFTTEGGTRKQLGAATVVSAGGKEVVIVYESKDGSPYIKEVRAGGDGLPSPFLTQFAGKGHDDKFVFGTNFKANGADEATAKAITTAIAVDVMTMQALYGAAHTH